jgi:hypothetical protein
MLLREQSPSRLATSGTTNVIVVYHGLDDYAFGFPRSTILHPPSQPRNSSLSQIVSCVPTQCGAGLRKTFGSAGNVLDIECDEAPLAQ